MKRIDQIILVDNNHLNASSVVKALEQGNCVENIKVAVNGEHALLCLDHLELYKRMKGRKIMVILNTNDFDFLEGYKWKKYPDKEQILIVVTDSGVRESIEKARSMGVADVLTTPLKSTEVIELADKYFEKKTEVKIKKRKFENRQQLSA